MGCKLAKVALQLSKEFKVNIKSKPQGLSTKLFKWADKIIIVADNVPIEIFSSHSVRNKVIKLNIHDCYVDDIGKTRVVVKQIESYVKKLIDSI